MGGGNLCIYRLCICLIPYVRMYACIHACMYVCMYVHIHIIQEVLEAFAALRGGRFSSELLFRHSRFPRYA